MSYNPHDHFEFRRAERLSTRFSLDNSLKIWYNTPMTMTKHNLTSDADIKAMTRAGNFIFKYRCATTDGGTAWKMEGLVAHVLWIEEPQNLSNSTSHCEAIGFVAIDDETVRVFRGIFSNNTTRGSWWHGWQTEDMTRGEARRLYALKLREKHSTTASTVVPRSLQFI